MRAGVFSLDPDHVDFGPMCVRSLLTLVLVAACSGGKDDGRASTSDRVSQPVVAARDAVPATGVSASAASTDASAQLAIPKPGKLTCDRIVSASVRRKFFADHTLRDVQEMSASDSMAYCLIDQGAAAFSIEVDCAVGTEQAIKMERHMHVGWKPLAGVGAYATISRCAWCSPSRTSLHADDDDSTCIIDADFPVEQQTYAIALVKQFLAELPLADAAASTRIQ